MIVRWHRLRAGIRQIDSTDLYGRTSGVGKSSFSVLVDALGAFMNGRQPDLSWLR